MATRIGAAKSHLRDAQNALTIYQQEKWDDSTVSKAQKTIQEAYLLLRSMEPDETVLRPEDQRKVAELLRDRGRASRARRARA